VWDVTVFTKNRERLIAGGVSERLLLAVVEQAHARRLLSEEHFTVDGTLIQAWANRRSFKERKDPPERGSGTKGEKLLRDTHESSTDPESRLYRKSRAGAALPSYLGHVLTENRNGLVVRAMATQSGNAAEREAALAMLDTLARTGEQATLGADKGYQHERFIQGLRERRIAPHVAEFETNAAWPNFLTEAERSDLRMPISQSKRKLVEKVFGWAKLDRTMRQVKMRGLKRVDFHFRLVVTAQNLLRMAKLAGQPA
jgi:hypothetical protein